MDGGTIFCLSLLNQGKEAGGRPSFSSIFGGSELVIDSDHRALFLSSPLFILVGVFGPMLTGHTPF
jgi:hypothetical protein